jgi:uncharacterized protein
VLRRRRLDLPPGWPRLDLLHVSDLHLRRSDARLQAAIRNLLRRLPAQPDLVCVTGDLCEQLDDVPLVLDVLRPLRPRLGLYLILGNHEYNAPTAPGLHSGRALEALFRVVFRAALSRGPAEGEAIVQALVAHGLHVLRNAGVRLEVDGRSVWLGGVDSVWAGLADPAAALNGRMAGEPTLVLVHETEAAAPAIEHGADLVLAGHTHGGQVRLPFLGAPYSHRVDPRIRIASGLQPLSGGLLHICAGTGQLIPLRFGCPPEIVWLRCQPQA